VGVAGVAQLATVDEDNTSITNQDALQVTNGVSSTDLNDSSTVWSPPFFISQCLTEVPNRLFKKSATGGRHTEALFSHLPSLFSNLSRKGLMGCRYRARRRRWAHLRG
jgi:hypothetical protein